MAKDRRLNLAATTDIKAANVHNVEAEQALLGIALFDNAGALERIDHLEAEDFYEPFHGGIWAAIKERVAASLSVDPILLADHFRESTRWSIAFEELGGLRYLADLIDRAPPAFYAVDYAKAIADLSLRRKLIRAADEMKAIAYSADGTAATALEEAEKALSGFAEGRDKGGGYVTFREAMDKAMTSAVDAAERKGGLAGLSTGLTDLDAKTGGLAPSDLIVLAGRPSMGKTSLGVNIAYAAAKAGKIVAIPSLEMGEGQLAMRIMADRASINGDRIRRGQLDVFELQQLGDAREELSNLPIYIDPTGGIAIEKLAARARRLKAKVGLDLIIVDYLQLVTASGANPDNRVQVVGVITGGLKALAKELEVPVIALSQLSRGVESRTDKRPMLSDLRESGSIEQDADQVWFLYRDSYYLGRAEPPETKAAEHEAWLEEMARVEGVAECIIAKQRHGPIGTVKLHFDENTTRFSNLARDRFYRDPTGSN